MAPRLVELRRVLKSTGSLWLHCDPTASHYLKMLLDSIFDPRRLLNEVTWKLWVANYYSARNPLRLSSLVILGVVARMFRCATRSSCWCT